MKIIRYYDNNSAICISAFDLSINIYYNILILCNMGISTFDLYINIYIITLLICAIRVFSKERLLLGNHTEKNKKNYNHNKR